MHGKRITVGAGLLALGAGLLLAPEAGATAPPPTLRIGPATVLAGQPLEFGASCYGTNRTEVTSPGLAASVSLTPNGGGYVGHGRAGNRAGHFTAGFTCTGGPTRLADGTATADFTVVCTPPVTPPASTTPTSTTTSPEPPSSSEPPTSATSTSPVPSSAAATPASSATCTHGSSGPQVRVLPKGAPETGDGSEAG